MLSTEISCAVSVGTCWTVEDMVFVKVTLPRIHGERVMNRLVDFDVARRIIEGRLHSLELSVNCFRLSLAGCTEEIRLDCTGMFPKPSPACGVYNEATQSYLSTVSFLPPSFLPFLP